MIARLKMRMATSKLQVKQTVYFERVVGMNERCSKIKGRYIGGILSAAICLFNKYSVINQAQFTFVFQRLFDDGIRSSYHISAGTF